MEETKDVTQKAKRLKTDAIKEVLHSYYQKRNYNQTVPKDLSVGDYKHHKTMESKLSQPNVVSFACWNNKDSFVIDNNYSKFINWLKEIRAKNGPSDLENLTGPLFCHMYLELYRRGLVEQATNFFNLHVPSVDKANCDSGVRELISAVSEGTDELSAIKDTFRSNKYVIHLSSESCRLLKGFILAKCHVVFLQIMVTWFDVREIDEGPANSESEEDEQVANGYACAEDFSPGLALKAESSPLYTVHLSNVKEDVSCGLISRSYGVVAYCYNNSTHLRSIGTLRNLPNAEHDEIVFRNHAGRIYDVTIIEEHALLATASFDKNISIFKLADYTRHCTLKGHNYPVYSLATSPNGAYLASGSYDATIRLWSLDTNKTLRVYGGHRQEITSLDFHPNSIYFASSSADKAVRMWTISTPMPVRLLHGSEGAVYRVRVSPSGRHIVCSGEDKLLRVWDIRSSKQLVDLNCGKEAVTEICWSDDQKTLATGSTNGRVCVWDIDGIINGGSEKGRHEAVCCRVLERKLLHVEWAQESFGCLTAETNASTFNDYLLKST